MTHARPESPEQETSRVAREWSRIRGQICNNYSLFRSFAFRRRALKSIRDRVHHFEAIPLHELAPRIARAFPLKSQTAPRVSVIIPVFNKFSFTARCLLSLAELATDVPFEIIVVDDGSTDQTEQALAGLPGLGFHKNPANLGFVDSCNAGARTASGEYLVFLNNDTLVIPGWLEALLHTFAIREDCGLVGSMLIYPDMTLQEAGGTLYRDGSASNRGKGRDIGAPDFNFLCPVDYCSGASIMISAELFRRIGEFDTRYRPAYYEDADLAFAVRMAGFRVYYQPASKVVHFEGITAGKKTSQGVKAHQVTNRLRFLEKWAEPLAHHPERHGAETTEAPEGSVGRILVLDNQTPKPDRDAGSLEMFNALRIMKRLGYQVDYVPLYRPKFVPRYTQLLQQEGVRCFFRPYFRSLKTHLKQHDDYDFLFISRIKTIRNSYACARDLVPDAKIIFNTVDLNFLRVGREAELKGSRALARKAEKFRAEELHYLNRADASIIISPVELDLIAKDIDPSRIQIIPLIRELPSARASFQQSQGIAFIGHFTHRPNVDAMRFFLSEIWPALKIKMPGVRFNIIGQGFPADLPPLLDESVKVHGLVPDLDSIFPTLRLCVAPLRYGAGLKGKLATSLAYGVPSVVSPIAVEGMALLHGQHVLVADSPESWVQHVSELYYDQALWEKISSAGLQFVEDEFSLEINAKRFQALFQRLKPAQG